MNVLSKNKLPSEKLEESLESDRRDDQYSAINIVDNDTIEILDGSRLSFKQFTTILADYIVPSSVICVYENDNMPKKELHRFCKEMFYAQVFIVKQIIAHIIDVPWDLKEKCFNLFIDVLYKNISKIEEKEGFFKERIVIKNFCTKDSKIKNYGYLDYLPGNFIGEEVVVTSIRDIQSRIKEYNDCFYISFNYTIFSLIKRLCYRLKYPKAAKYIEYPSEEELKEISIEQNEFWNGPNGIELLTMIEDNLYMFIESVTAYINGRTVEDIPCAVHLYGGGICNMDVAMDALGDESNRCDCCVQCLKCYPLEHCSSLAMLIPFTDKDIGKKTFERIVHEILNVSSDIDNKFLREYVYFRTFVLAMMVHRISGYDFYECLRNLYFEVKGIYKLLPDEITPQINSIDFKKRIFTDYLNLADDGALLKRKFMDIIFDGRTVESKITVSQYIEWFYEDLYKVFYKNTISILNNEKIKLNRETFVKEFKSRYKMEKNTSFIGKLKSWFKSCD